MIEKTALLVDDHPLFRKGVREAVNSRTQYQVVAEASSAQSALTLAKVHQPSLAVVDLALPDLSGLSLLKAFRQSNASMRCVVMTLYNDTALIEEALSLGAIGYLMKADGVEVLESCLKDADEGRVYLSPGVSSPPPAQPTPIGELGCWQDVLSRRERQVLQGIGQHLTSREIADTLHLSTRTVQNHRARMSHKLQLNGANALYRFALEHAAQLRRGNGSLE